MTAIELHGADAAVHDYHAGPGSFAAAIAALVDTPAATVTTLVTRSSYRVLSALPALLQAHRVAHWRLPIATSSTHPARLVPRLAMALPFALHAVDRAGKLGVDAAIVDAPLCLLGPLAARAVVTAPRSFPAPCTACTLRPRCGGVDPAYLARFGAAELSPY